MQRCHRPTMGKQIFGALLHRGTLPVTLSVVACVSSDATATTTSTANADASTADFVPVAPTVTHSVADPVAAAATPWRCSLQIHAPDTQCTIQASAHKQARGRPAQRAHVVTPMRWWAHPDESQEPSASGIRSRGAMHTAIVEAGGYVPIA